MGSVEEDYDNEIREFNNLDYDGQRNLLEYSKKRILMERACPECVHITNDKLCGLCNTLQVIDDPFNKINIMLKNLNQEGQKTKFEELLKK